MKPAIVIPSYWSSGERLGEAGSVACYDHATPIDSEQPQLAECLKSLEQVAGLGTVVVLVVSSPDVEERAVRRVADIVASSKLPDVVIVDSFKAAGLRDQYAHLLPAELSSGVGLVGYGAIRNLGLLCCCALGCDVAVFLDDDEIVLDPEFLAQAVYGMGAQPRNGTPVVAKSGYFLDHRNSALADRRRVRFYDRHWSKRLEFNEWMTQALAGPRISRSNTVCGGCFAVHAEAFTRVSFDAWITRGEDTDYLIDLRAYGLDVWFDNKWRVRHNPPRIADRAFRFEQDVYRWVYTRRKIEVLNTNIDLHKILPEQFMPYPGPWIGPELPVRIRKTVHLRSLFSPERRAYAKIRRTWRKDSTAYAEQNCGNYMRFQASWPQITAVAWQNEAMERMLRAEGMLNEAVASHVRAARYGAPQPPVDGEGWGSSDPAQAQE